jgi:hypothetical protein
MQRLAVLIIGLLAVIAFAAAMADRSDSAAHDLRTDVPVPTEAQCTPTHDALPVPVRRAVLRIFETRMTPSFGGRRDLFSFAAESAACIRACGGREDRDFWRSGIFVRHSLQSAQVKLQT